jgi:hypothetical protein
MLARQPIPVRADPRALITANVNALARSVIAAAVASRGRETAAAVLRERFGDDPLASLILRAASSPATLASASALTQTRLIDDLLTVVGKVSAGAQVLQAGLQLHFDNAAVIAVAMLEADPSKASFIAEGQPIPVRVLAAKLAQLTPHKLAAISVLTSEMLASSNAEALVTDALSRSVGLAFDNGLFGSLAQPLQRSRRD